MKENRKATIAGLHLLLTWAKRRALRQGARKEMFDKIEVGDPSSPSSVFEKEAAKSIILKEMGTNRDLNKFL